MTQEEFNEELLEVVCCPLTQQKLAWLLKDAIEELNSRISAGKVVNKKGEVLKEELEAALVSEDGKIIYPVKNGIPMLLVECGVEN